MKHLIKIIIVTLSLTFQVACSTKANSVPSNNNAMNSISPSHHNENGALQKQYDAFEKEDWTPTVSEDKKIQKKYMKEVVVNEETNETTYIEDEERNFTLQEYVDKTSAYMDTKGETDHSKSNVTKLNSMPVIGK